MQSLQLQQIAKATTILIRASVFLSAELKILIMYIHVANCVCLFVCTIYVLIFVVYIFSLYLRMNPRPRKLILAKKIVLALFRYLYPTDSHLLDPKSYQEHCHTHTDTCSYTECVPNRKIVDLTFRNCEEKKKIRENLS